MPVKIIDLTGEPAPTDDDLIIIRDMTTGTTRKVTRATFFVNPPIADGALTTDMFADGSITKDKLNPDAVPTVRTSLITSGATLTPDIDNYDMFGVTALGVNFTLNAPTGTPVNGQGFLLRLKDDGNARTITYNAIYRPIGVTAPTATVAGKTLYIAFRYNAQATKWDMLSVGREA